DVDEAVEVALVVAHHHHRHQSGMAGEVLARLLDPVADAGVLPAAGEDAPLFLAEDGGVGEPAEGERDALIETGCEKGCHWKTLPGRGALGKGENGTRSATVGSVKRNVGSVVHPAFLTRSW